MSYETGTPRKLAFVTQGIPASDGDGVKMTRIIASPELSMLDPFLLLDLFESDKPQDYIGGFPDHPHRGFETVTYMLAGKMRHKDSMGNEGVIEANGVQWMTAGSGIIHSEMPEQEDGLLKGFQLWVNLPQEHKMTSPGYQEFGADSIPVEKLDNGTLIRVISGKTNAGTVGPVKNAFVTPTYLHVTLTSGNVFEQSIDADQNVMLVPISGDLLVGNEKQALPERTLGVLGDGTGIHLEAGESDSEFLLIAGKPLNESVARGGPFVMNTQDELVQAFDDYRQGRLVR